jgi:starch synthase
VRILFATPELAPWVKSGGLGDISAALPEALLAEGADVRLLVPGYAALLARCEPATHAIELPPPGGNLAPARLLEARSAGGVPLYAIDCPA